MAEQPPDGRHEFRITVAVKGASAEWSTDLVPQTVRAFNIVEALELAQQIPFPDWFEEDP